MQLDLGGLLLTIAFVIGALLIIPANTILDRRRARRDARRRNQARPWRR